MTFPFSLSIICQRYVYASKLLLCDIVVTRILSFFALKRNNGQETLRRLFCCDDQFLIIVTENEQRA